MTEDREEGEEIGADESRIWVLCCYFFTVYEGDIANVDDLLEWESSGV